MKKKILVLDDSPFMLTMIGDMLKKLNYEVTTVENGAEACQKVKSTRYDMIITDMNMPAMDGLEFTKRVKTYPNCKFVPIVMLSSEENTEKISTAKKMGISTFLSKPLKEAQLRTIVQITLNKRSTPRIPVKLEVLYGGDEMFSDYTAGYTLDVSGGGLFLETPNPLSLGERLKLKLVLPGKDPSMFFQGRVAWVNSSLSPSNSTHPPGMGVEFLNTEDEHQLQKFLQSGTWKS
jgi:two-component system chemotaxis response regulator CheY